MRSHLDSLERVTSGFLAPAASVLSRAFWNDPLTVYFFNAEEKRKVFLPAYFVYRLKQALRWGEVYATSQNLESIAVWRHSREIESSLWKDLRTGGLRLYRLCGSELITRMKQVDQFTIERRRMLAPSSYMHLGPLGTDPSHQGRGYATRLVRPMLDYLDERGLPCYLEAQSESNVSLYQHYGFEVVAEGHVPIAEIPHWDMIRLPS
jgi:ribosomal protein S18 acetylase RimI-like enzyme